MAGSNRVPFGRSPGEPFSDRQAEDYCRARAREQPIKEAGAFAGLTLLKARAFEGYPEIKARIAELRKGIEQLSNTSYAWCCEQLKVNAIEARKAEQFNASNNAIEKIVQLLDRHKDLLESAVANASNGTGTAPPVLASSPLDDLRELGMKIPNPDGVLS